MTNNELLQSFTVLLDQKFDQKFAEQDLRIKDLLDESFEANNQYLLNVGQRIEGDANDKLFFRPLKNRPRSLGANGRLTAIIRHIIGEY